MKRIKTLNTVWLPVLRSIVFIPDHPTYVGCLKSRTLVCMKWLNDHNIDHIINPDGWQNIDYDLIGFANLSDVVHFKLVFGDN